MVKLTPPVNENYAATVVKIRAVNQLDNCDNVVGVPVFGYQAITSKDVEVGGLYVLFTAETQISEEYARLNNLHRHSDRNDDESVKGYLEDNRRVKAMKFRGHRSEALLMPLSSLHWFLGSDYHDLKEGDTFDELNDRQICQKYVIKRKSGTPKFQQPKESRVDKRFLPEHTDTANYFRNYGVFHPLDYVVVTQKLHGTSIRIGNTLVTRKPKWYEKLAQFLGAKIHKFEYDYVFGSRKVIKDPNNPDQQHFYSTDLWTEEGKKLEGMLPQGYVIYGELIGWAEGKSPIQANYTYDVPEGNRHLYIYRVTHVNPEGRQIDLGWEQVKEFCRNLGLRHVPEIWYGQHQDFEEIVNDIIDERLSEFFTTAIVVSDPKSVDEGVCIRKEGLIPLILKAKSPIFLEHESVMLDREVVDVEAEEMSETLSEE